MLLPLLEELASYPFCTPPFHVREHKPEDHEQQPDSGHGVAKVTTEPTQEEGVQSLESARRNMQAGCLEEAPQASTGGDFGFRAFVDGATKTTGVVTRVDASFLRLAKDIPAHWASSGDPQLVVPLEASSEEFCAIRSATAANPYPLRLYH